MWNCNSRLQSGSVTLGKLLHLSGPWFPHLGIEMDFPPHIGQTELASLLLLLLLLLERGTLHGMQDSSTKGIKPVPPTVEAWSVNHWTTRESEMAPLIVCFRFFPLLNMVTTTRDSRPWSLGLLLKGSTTSQEKKKKLLNSIPVFKEGGCGRRQPLGLGWGG